MSNFLESAGMVPHGYCLLWKPWLIALHAGSDSVIFASYFIIPMAILRFLRARPDVRLGAVGPLFASFILLCGLTHLLGLITLWYPIYEIQGIVKLMTAAVSATTAAILFPLVPKLVALPSPMQLQRANAELEAEIAAHRETLEELRGIRAGLETEISERTRELTEANERLSVVSREAVHRSKNLLTVVQSIARQTASFAETKDELVERLSGRLASLATALSTVTESTNGGAKLGEVVGTQLAHYRDSYPGRISLDGPELPIRSEAAQQIGLAIHELATNAVKYGALSGPSGRIEVSWREEGEERERRLRLLWSESESGPPPKGRPAAMAGTGFGSLLLNRAVPMQLRGEARAEAAEGEYRYELSAPLAELRPRRVPDAPDAAAQATG